jgi:transmembrane sensor
MNQHNDFKEATDFLFDDSFVDWVEHGKNDAQWQNFLSQNPHKQPLIEQARLLIRAASKAPVHLPSEQLVGQIWANIQSTVTNEPVPAAKPRQLNRSVLWYWAAAASICLVAGWWVWQRQPTVGPVSYGQLVAQSAAPLRETVNRTTQAIPVALPDGTTVMLEPGSRLSYPATFEQVAHREVFLSGEAFFDVVKNPRQPFIVRAKWFTATVLGTSFMVRASENETRSFVQVRTGKVAVSTAPSMNGLTETPTPKAVILTPNQQLTLDQSGEAATPLLTETPVASQAVTDALPLVFEDAPLSTVFARLEKLHQVEIRFDEVALKDCRLSASLADEPLFVKLRLICKTLGGSYQVIDNQIVVQAPGCGQ